MEGLQNSIARRQNMVAQYIASQPILELCKRVNRWPGVWVSRQWWKKARIDLEGARKQAEESMNILETELEEESDGEPNGVAGGEEDSQGASGSSGAEWSGTEDG